MIIIILIFILNMPIYKQSVNTRRMTGMCWAPPGEYIASYISTAYCFDRHIRLFCSCIASSLSVGALIAHDTLARIRGLAVWTGAWLKD